MVCCNVSSLFFVSQHFSKAFNHFLTVGSTVNRLTYFIPILIWCIHWPPVLFPPAILVRFENVPSIAHDSCRLFSSQLNFYAHFINPSNRISVDISWQQPPSSNWIFCLPYAHFVRRNMLFLVVNHFYFFSTSYPHLFINCFHATFITHEQSYHAKRNTSRYILEIYQYQSVKPKLVLCRFFGESPFINLREISVILGEDFKSYLNFWLHLESGRQMCAAIYSNLDFIQTSLNPSSSFSFTINHCQTPQHFHTKYQITPIEFSSRLPFNVEKTSERQALEIKH